MEVPIPDRRSAALDRIGESMNGKRLPVILGLVLLPAVALGPAQMAQAATGEPAISSVTGMQHDPATDESQESERSRAESIQQEPMQRGSMRQEEPGEEQSLQEESEQSEQSEQSGQSGQSGQEQYGRPMGEIVEHQS
jgi:hypothetical protein